MSFELVHMTDLEHMLVDIGEKSQGSQTQGKSNRIPVLMSMLFFVLKYSIKKANKNLSCKAVGLQHQSNLYVKSATRNEQVKYFSRFFFQFH